MDASPDTKEVLINKGSEGSKELNLAISELMTPRVNVLCGFIKLNKSIETHNYYAMLLHSLMLGMILSGTELLQQNLLTDENYYAFDTATAAQVNSYITLEDLLTKFMVTPIYGALIDKLGRRKMALSGYIIVSISYVLFPLYHYSPSLFSSIAWYFLVRFLFANGAAIVPILPMIADYIEDSHKGRAIGINILFLSSGFLLSTMIIGFLGDNDIYDSYLVLTIIILVGGITAASFLKPGNTYYQTGHISPHGSPNKAPQAKQSVKSMIVNASKAKPWIIAGYLFAFLNGGGLAICGQIINLYVQDFNPPNPKQLGNSIVKLSNLATVLTSLCLGPGLDFINPLWVDRKSVV